MYIYISLEKELYYFYLSGVLGSGICILSKSCIVDAALCQFSLNGYAHKILHGDWYGGKGVGLCKVIHHGIKINLYVTHVSITPAFLNYN